MKNYTSNPPKKKEREREEGQKYIKVSWKSPVKQQCALAIGLLERNKPIGMLEDTQKHFECSPNITHR